MILNERLILEVERNEGHTVPIYSSFLNECRVPLDRISKVHPCANASILKRYPCYFPVPCNAVSNYRSFTVHLRFVPDSLPTSASPGGRGLPHKPNGPISSFSSTSWWKVTESLWYTSGDLMAESSSPKFKIISSSGSSKVSDYWGLGLALASSTSLVSVDESPTTLVVISILGPKAEIELTAGVAGALHRPKEPWTAMIVKLAKA